MKSTRPWFSAAVVVAFIGSMLAPALTVQARSMFAPGTVVALQGTPHLWFADDQGVLHWSGDTRALAGRYINWNSRVEVSLEQLRTLPGGDPWLSTGLLKDGDPIYFPKWETEWAAPRLFHIQSIRDVELFGINSSNYGTLVLERPVWESRSGFSAADLQRSTLPVSVPPSLPKSQSAVFSRSPGSTGNDNDDNDDGDNDDTDTATATATATGTGDQTATATATATDDGTSLTNTSTDDTDDGQNQLTTTATDTATATATDGQTATATATATDDGTSLTNTSTDDTDDGQNQLTTTATDTATATATDGQTATATATATDDGTSVTHTDTDATDDTPDTPDTDDTDDTD